MKKYLRQLLHDIRRAHRPEQEMPDPPCSIEEELEASEHFVLSDPPHTFADHCGLRREQFPPAERLTGKQLTRLMDALKEMMWTYGVVVSLPESLPPEQRYHWLLCALDEKIHLMGWGGMVDISFCGEEPETCIFGSEHCTCRLRADDWEYNRLTSETHERAEDLLSEIRRAVAAMPETLEFQGAVTALEQDLGGGEIVYKPLAEWLELELGRFPAPEELSELELEALAEALLSVFNREDELAQVVRSVTNPERRYEAAMEYWVMPVHHDGMGNYHFKPFSLEEQRAMLSNIESPLDDLDFRENDLPPADWKVDEMPF